MQGINAGERSIRLTSGAMDDGKNMVLEVSEIKGIIFDIDGTVLDTMPMWDTICEQYLISLGGVPMEDLNEKVLNMTIDEGIHYIKGQYGLKQSEEELKAGLIDMVRKFYYEEAPFKPGAENMIHTLQGCGVPMAVATSGDKDLSGTALRRLGVRQYMREIFSCNDLDTSKSEPMVFYRTAEVLLGRKQVEFENDKELLSKIYVIEDSLKAAKTVKAAGFSVIAVEDEAGRNTWEELRETADIYVHSLEEIEIC